MGGRKEDLVRTPSLRLRQRPLSVIAEDEGDEREKLVPPTILVNGDNISENEEDKDSGAGDDSSSPQSIGSQNSLSSLGSQGSLTPSSPLSPFGPINPEMFDSDLSRLKDTATRLNLTTRRASYVAWQDQVLTRPPPAQFDVTSGKDGRLTAERKQKIDDALQWLRNELRDMRVQDQALARQLLAIRHDLHQLKLRRCCEEHQVMLDDVQSELEELEEFANVLDLPAAPLSDNPLKHLGVTRMNLNTRRFSMC